jgi:hypothetical protein
VIAKTPVELPVGDVERHDGVGPGLEQTVGEAAGGSTDIEAETPARVEPEGLERVRELDPAS